jgi:hypothetical protein
MMQHVWLETTLKGELEQWIKVPLGFQSAWNRSRSLDQYVRSVEEWKRHFELQQIQQHFDVEVTLSPFAFGPDNFALKLQNWFRNHKLRQKSENGRLKEPRHELLDRHALEEFWRKQHPEEPAGRIRELMQTWKPPTFEHLYLRSAFGAVRVPLLDERGEEIVTHESLCDESKLKRLVAGVGGSGEFPSELTRAVAARSVGEEQEQEMARILMERRVAQAVQKSKVSQPIKNPNSSRVHLPPAVDSRVGERKQPGKNVQGTKLRKSHGAGGQRR